MKRSGVLLLSMIFILESFAQNADAFRLPLQNAWKMQSSLTATASGNQISQPEFLPKGWYNVNVPTTIIAGLLANNEYGFDPFFGKNLEKISDTRFDHSWWFRKDFSLPPSQKGKNVILKLHGINYKANVWLN